MTKKIINIREIAERAACSPSTVSRVLAGRSTSIKISEETCARVRKVCAELDYQPSIHAARLFSRQARVVGFLTSGGLYPEDDNLFKSFFHLCRELNKTGYRILPLLGNDPEELLNTFKRNEIDALIVWGARENDSFLSSIRDANYPMLLLTNKISGYPSVYSEQQTPVRKLTEACIRNGARRLAGIMSSQGFSYQQRANGFRQVVESGLAASCEHKIWDFVSADGSILENAYALAPEVLAWNPDAVVCCNDEVAVAIGRYCIEQKIQIPDRLFLTGGDNVKLAEYSQIPLTTFDQMAAECAKAAVHILMSHLRDHQKLHSQEIPAEVIWRKSLPEEKIRRKK